MTKDGVRAIAVTESGRYNPSRLRIRIVNTGVGKVIIDMLYPNTLYAMEVAAYNNHIAIFAKQTALKTWLNGKFLVNYTHSISLHACIEIFIDIVK